MRTFHKQLKFHLQTNDFAYVFNTFKFSCYLCCCPIAYFIHFSMTMDIKAIIIIIIIDMNRYVNVCDRWILQTLFFLLMFRSVSAESIRANYHKKIGTQINYKTEGKKYCIHNMKCDAKYIIAIFIQSQYRTAKTQPRIVRLPIHHSYIYLCVVSMHLRLIALQI